jgi:PAS domain-containing protein
VAIRTRRQKSLALIRAREVATNLSIPIVVFDPEGTIVFYNPAAEAMLGETFEEAGELSADDWVKLFAPEQPDGTPLPLEELPAGVALLERKPDHKTIHYTSVDGVRREISVTAFPLMGREEELYGAFAIFWSV